MDEQLNSNQEPQKITPPPVRTPSVSDVKPPTNLPMDSTVMTESSFPAAPKTNLPEVGMRTMESDINALKGGVAPKSVLPPNMKDIKEVPETVSQLGGPAISEEARGGWAKAVMIVLGIIIVGGGLGFVGYYYVYPSFFGKTPEVPVTAQPTPEPKAELPAPLTHISLFKTQVAKTEVKFRQLSAVTITQAFQNVGREADGTLKEAVLLNADNGQVLLTDFLSNLVSLSDADKNLLNGSLGRDFTAFLYYDTNGVWPGYVMKLKSPAEAEKLKKDFMPVFELFDLSSFYVSPSGAFQPFKDGKYNGMATRYAVGSASGASFNYAFAGDYLVLSTSFNGFKAAVMALGL